jgi:hypothetical protein
MEEKGDVQMDRSLGKVGILGIAVFVVAWIALIVAACSSATTPKAAEAMGRPALPPEPAPNRRS